MKYTKQADGTYAPNPGHEALWNWFSLSYASWLTLPRAMMHEMPDDWQARMAALLSEWDEAWTKVPDDVALDTCVSTKEGGRFKKTPRILLNYRHPDRATIQSWMTTTPADGG